MGQHAILWHNEVRMLAPASRGGLWGAVSTRLILETETASYFCISQHQWLPISFSTLWVSTYDYR